MWNDITITPPPENENVLVYTDNGTMKVARLFNGRWDTYLKITHWQKLPEKPKKIKKEN